MISAVEIRFDCLPLRSVGRLDAPLDASHEQRELCHQVKQAIETHGAHNSYYLRDGECIFHVTNDPAIGVISYRFRGVVLTDAADLRTQQTALEVEFAAESCDWLTRPVADWFAQSVPHAVAVDFNRFIADGNVTRAVERMNRIQEQIAASGGFLGMYL